MKSIIVNYTFTICNIENTTISLKYTKLCKTYSISVPPTFL